MSFFPVLPWTTCDNYWNTATCIGKKLLSNGTNTSFFDTLVEIHANSNAIMNYYKSTNDSWNTNDSMATNHSRRMSASEEFWE